MLHMQEAWGWGRRGNWFDCALDILFPYIIIHIHEDSFVPHNYTDAQKIAFKFYIMIGQFNVHTRSELKNKRRKETATRLATLSVGKIVRLVAAVVILNTVR